MGVDQHLTEAWQEPGTVREVLQHLSGRIRDAGGRVVDNTEDSLTAEFGSRLAFRAFGALMKAGRERVPARLVVQVVTADDDGAVCRITATAFSNEGAYLVTTPLATHVYEERLPALLARMQTA